MAELPQYFLRSTTSGNDAITDGEVAGPAFDEPESSRDRSSALTGEPLRIRRDTAVVAAAPSPMTVGPKAKSLIISVPTTLFLRHWSIEQMEELFPASIDEEELIDPHRGGSDDPHEELAQHVIDRLFPPQ
ncbi:hypothetical protein HPB50_014180 [Hyalomma asiaticum]|uniref:Uncharacterized protein n=1 Tax=Hyalomma asiaticum TaxID=266040 RepID=A0ACB7SQE9_HYAAI|nr:hypothetical protein HPB50_014180 [Hyalomma asiaticum]